MRYVNKAFGLFVLLSVFTACKKDQQEPKQTNQHVYTNGREITDETVKQRFIQRSSLPFASAGTPGPNDVIQFVAPDTATFGTSSIRFFTTRNGTQRLFYSLAPVWVSNPDDVLRKMLKYTAPLTPVATSTGFSYLTQEVRVGYQAGSSIRLSRVQYRFKRNGGGSITDASGVLFNEFDTAVVGSVRAGDTLAVQESSLTLPVQ